MVSGHGAGAYSLSIVAPDGGAYATGVLIRRRMLDPVNDEHVDGSRGRLQFEPELLLQRLRERRLGILRP